MRTKDALIAAVKSARGWTKAWGGDFREADARRSGRSPANPIAWQLGHIACAQDDVLRLFPGQRGVVPSALRAVCATGSPLPRREREWTWSTTR